MFLSKVKRKCILVILSIGFVIITIYIISNIINFYSSLLHNYTNLLDNHTVFNDIRVLDILDQYVITEIDDPLIETLPYKDKYCFEIMFNDTTFNIYAYDFCNVIDTIEYFNSVAGRDTNRHLTEIALSNSSFPVQQYYKHITSDECVDYVIYSNTKLYHITCPDVPTFVSFQNWLNTYFLIYVD